MLMLSMFNKKINTAMSLKKSVSSLSNLASKVHGLLRLKPTFYISRSTVGEV